MPIAFRCGQCGKSYQAPDHLAGKKVKCRNCGAAAEVPAAEAPAGGVDLLGSSLDSLMPPSGSGQPGNLPGGDPWGGSGLGNAGLGGAGLGAPGLGGAGLGGPGFGSPYAANPQPKKMSGLQIALLICGGVLGLLLLFCGGTVYWIYSRISHNVELAVEAQERAAQQRQAQQQALPPAPQPANNRSAPQYNTPANGVNRSTPRFPTIKPANPPVASMPSAGNPSPQGSIPTRLAGNLPADPLPAALEFQFEPTEPLAMPLSGSGDVVFPRSPSPFMGIKGYEKQHFIEVWDLRTLKRLGRCEGEDIPRGSNETLSPDGRYFACQRNSNGKFLIDVWSLELGKRLLEIPSPKHCAVVDFAGADELLLVHSPSEQNKSASQVQIIDLKTGKGVRDFHTRDSFQINEERFALSPGRHYLALVESPDRTPTLLIYDLNTGREAGSTTLRGDTNAWQEAVGVAFSPEGDEVCALTKLNHKLRLTAWKFGGNEPVADHMLEEQYSKHTIGRWGYDGPALEPLYDRAGWLVFGHVLIDRKSGRKFFDLPEGDASTRDQPRRVMGRSQFLLVNIDDRRNEFLTSMSMSAEKLAAMAEAVQSGGQAIDAELPALTPADWSKVKTVEIPQGKIAWEVKPDPAPAAKETLLAQPLELKSRQRETVDVLFSGPEAGLAVAYNVANNQNRPASVATATDPVWLDRYDLAAGKHLDRLDLPRGSRLVDVSLDGSRALVANGDRFDVWSLADGKHIAGWRPNSEVDAKNQKKTTWARFVDNERVLSRSDTKRIVLWRLPKCQAEYVLEEMTPSNEQIVVGLSPGRKYALTVLQKKDAQLRDGPAVCLHLEAATGQLRGVSAVPPVLRGMVSLMDVRYRPDGQQVALDLQGHGMRQLAIVDLASGSLSVDAPIGYGTNFHWAGARHLLLGYGELFDNSRRYQVWRMNLPHASKVVGEAGDGRTYVVVNPRDSNANVWLAAGQLPDAATLAKIDATVPAAGASPPPLRPGMNVSLSVEVDGPDDAAGKVRAHFTNELKANGQGVAEGQPVRLVVRSSVTGTDTVEYRPGLFGFGRRNQSQQNFSITLTHLQCDVEFQTANGRSLWKTGSALRGYGPTSISAKDGDDMQKHIDRIQNQHHDRARDYFLSVHLPRTIYGPPPEKLGFTQVSFPGVIDRPQPAQVANNPRLPQRGQPNPGQSNPTQPSPEPALDAAEIDKLCREFVAKAYAEVLKSDSDAVWNSLRYSEKLGRPLVGIRWGVGTEVSEQWGGRDLENFSNYAGEPILEGLAERVSKGDFGDFPASGDPQVRRPVLVGMGIRGKLLTSARRRYLDLLLVADVDVKAAGLNRRSDTSVTMRLFDVASGEQLGASEPLKAFRSDIGRQFSEYVLKQIDEQYRTQPVNDISSAAAASRMEALTKKQAHPLAALVEARYYQRKSLVPPEKVLPLYQTLLGNEDGRLLAEADEAQRKELIDKWLPKWIEGE